MGSSTEYKMVVAPREGVGEDIVRVVEWLIEDGSKVRAEQLLVVLETSKAAFEVNADGDGFLFHLVKVNDEVAVGSPLAVISKTRKRPEIKTAKESEDRAGEGADPVVTRMAKELIRRHDLSLDHFSGLSVIRASDVEDWLSREGRRSPEEPIRTFGDDKLDPKADWDAVYQSEEYRKLMQVMTDLRRRMKAKFGRHVPSSELLYDRWQLARDYGFGEGTSVYDQCLILGDVTVGRNCWIGPYTVLDGYHAPLTIGNHTSVGAGAQIYTHNTIEGALTGDQAPLFRSATRIGECCFISPSAIIGPGSVLGDHCFVAAGSYVEGVFPAFSYVAGNPGQRVGRIEIRGNRAWLRRGPRK